MIRFAGETLSDARMETSEGPRVTVSGASEIAGDRPPRYGIEGILVREGQALALRAVGVQEIPNHVIQNAAVLVVVDFDWGIDADSHFR